MEGQWIVVTGGCLVCLVAGVVGRECGCESFLVRGGLGDRYRMVII